VSRTLPQLIEEKDMVADLHMHTDRTDGRDTMRGHGARGTRSRPSLLRDHRTLEGVARRAASTKSGSGNPRSRSPRCSARFPDIRILHGLEVDILAEGELDLADEALASLDWVLISLHSRLDQAPDVITERVVKAISHPSVCAMAHPTARMILNREPGHFDLERVLERAAERGVAMEINAQPNRLDLKDTHSAPGQADGSTTDHRHRRAQRA
jgi:DNA polymerase (family 10)